MAALLERRAKKGQKVQEQYNVAPLPTEPQTRQCSGVTKTGELCRRSVDKDCSEPYCWQHKDTGEKAPEKVPVESKKVPKKVPATSYAAENLALLQEIIPDAKWDTTETVPTLLNEDDTIAYGKLLGTGSFGRVYKLIVKKTGKIYALKLFNLSVHPRFPKTEVNLLRKISQYPNCNKDLLCLYGIFKVPEGDKFEYAILYEYLNGQTLEGLIERPTLLPVEQMHIARWLVNTVNNLHAQGIVHRDIKPANIMVIFSPAPFLSQENRSHSSETDPFLVDRIESLKLLDFGFACRVAAKAAKNDIVCKPNASSTPLYAAPEIYTNQDIDYFKVDAFSVGATLYEMLEGYGSLTSRGEFYEDFEHVKSDEGAHLSQLPRPLTEPRCFGDVIYGLIQNNPEKRMALSEASKELRYCNYQ